MDGDGDGFSAGFVECFAGTSEEALEVVCAGVSWVNFDTAAFSAISDFDECGEEVMDSVTELLDVGVLVSGAFVAVDCDALVDDVFV